MAFIDRFFPREIREEKVVEFINLPQGGKSVHEYSLELVMFSRYASSLVSDPRDKLISSVMKGIVGLTIGVPIVHAT